MCGSLPVCGCVCGGPACVWVCVWDFACVGVLGHCYHSMFSRVCVSINTCVVVYMCLCRLLCCYQCFVYVCVSVSVSVCACACVSVGASVCLPGL